MYNNICFSLRKYSTKDVIKLKTVNLTVRQRIFIPMIALTVLCSTAILGSSIFLYSRSLTNAAYDRIGIAAIRAEHLLNTYKSNSYIAASEMAQNQELKKAIKNNNREEILAVADNLRNIVKAEFCTITDNTGTIIARTHEPDNYGDSIAYQHNIQSALSGKTETFIERGSAVLLSVRTGAPIYDENGGVMAVVSIGYRLDTQDFVFLLRERTGGEATVFLGNERIATTVLNIDDTYAIGTLASDAVTEKVMEGGVYDGKVWVAGRELIAEYFPLYGANDEIVGMIFVGEYTAGDASKTLSFFMSGLIITLFLLTLCIVLAMIMSDNIERRLEEQAEKTREADAQMQIMLDTTPLCVNFWDANLNNISTNEESVRFFGLKNKQEYLDRFFELSPEYQPDGQLSRDLSLMYLNKALDEGFCRLEWMHQKLNGEPLPCEVTLVRVKYKGDYVVAGYAKDMREIKAAVEEMHKAVEAKNTLSILGNILNSLDTMVLVTDPATDNIMFINDTMKHIYNIEGSGIGRRCYELLQENLTERCSFCPCHALEKNPERIILWEEKSVKTGRTYRNTDRLIKWTDGRSVHLQHTVDVTEMKATADTLDKRLEQQALMMLISQSFLSSKNMETIIADAFKTIGEFMGISQILLYIKQDGDDGTILCQNEWINPVLGLSSRIGGVFKLPQNAIQLYLDIRHKEKFYITPEDPETERIMAPYRRSFTNYIGTSVFLDGELYALIDFSRPDGEEWSQDNLNMALFISNILTGALYRQRTEQALIAAKEVAEQSSHSKSVFLANMSHEIRTPMNAILGIAEIELLDSKLPPEAEESFAKIYDSGSLLLSIVNDILDLSKIEAGKLEIIPVRYDIPSLVNDTVQLNRLRYESKPIEFIVNIDENTPHELMGDELRIKQILNNLLSNAFKYTERGEVTMHVSAEEENGVTFLIFRVTDTGQGMTEKELGSIFDEYTRFNMDANRTTIGTGLGMNITKRLIDMMDGKIVAESEAGIGSTFTVYLPQERVSDAVCGPETAEKLKQFRFKRLLKSIGTQVVREYMPYGSVLIVDDVESNLYVAKGLLQPYGLTIETAVSGFEAVEKVEAGKVYDIIFMDHMMPKMDGMETTRVIRRMGYIRPIVALTANAVTGQAEIFMANGFDRFISKPIDSRELNAVLNELIRDKQPEDVIKAARRERAPEGQVASETENDKKTPAAAEISAVRGEAAIPVLSELESLFIEDAENATTVLSEICAKQNAINDKDFKSFTIAAHGIKSALANIGETELSKTAFKLEQAGYAKETGVILSETPVLLNSLKTVTENLKTGKKPTAGTAASGENSVSNSIGLRGDSVSGSAALGENSGSKDVGFRGNSVSGSAASEENSVAKDVGFRGNSVSGSVALGENSGSKDVGFRGNSVLGSAVAGRMSVTADTLSAISDKDLAYLRDKLFAIKAACAVVDKNSAQIPLDFLKKREWPDDIRKILDNITALLSQNALKKTAELAEATIKQVSRD